MLILIDLFVQVCLIFLLYELPLCATANLHTKQGRTEKSRPTVAQRGEARGHGSMRRHPCQLRAIQATLHQLTRPAQRQLPHRSIGLRCCARRAVRAAAVTRVRAEVPIECPSLLVLEAV